MIFGRIFLLYIYINIFLCFSFHPGLWRQTAAISEVGKKNSSCRLQSDPKTNGEDQVGLHCSWNLDV